MSTSFYHSYISHGRMSVMFLPILSVQIVTDRKYKMNIQIKEYMLLKEALIPDMESH